MSGCGGCASARDRCGNGLEKIYPSTAVRYGRMRMIGEFTHDPDMLFTCGGKVVIQTDRGIEVGQQVSLTCTGCDKSVSRDQMRAYAKASGGESYRLNNGRILREATASDLAELKHIEDAIFDKIQACRRQAEQLELPMKIVDGEHIFGGERIIFYFMAEDRIDFRELVRVLAREFQTRIEMRQVGARDEARLLADYETCGRECCCKNFLKTLKPVGMQMAKLQKATLDPSKVSGRCGRLKCCLRYEHESYADLNKKLPRLGRRVRTESEEGVVIDRQILTQLLRLRKDDGVVVTVCEEDIVERDIPHPPPPQAGGPEDQVQGRPDRRRSGPPAGDGRPGRRDRSGGREGRGSPPPADRAGEPARPPRPESSGQEPQEPGSGPAADEKPEDAFGPVLDEGPAEAAPDTETDETPNAEAGGAPGSTDPGSSRPPGRRGRGRRRRRRGKGPSGPAAPPGDPA